MFTAKTDAELCRASSEGHSAAFAELVRRYQGAVCAVTYAATGRRDVSEDLAQETFLIAWKKLPGIALPDRVGGWLAGIARNLARKSKRAAVDVPLEDMESVGNEAMGMEETVLEKESRQQVWRLLETLPSRYREVLVLYYREGRGTEHVAQRLGISRSATEQRLSRGRRLLRDKVERAMERELSRTAPSDAFTRRVAAALPLAPIATGTGAGSTGLTPWLGALGKTIIMKKLVAAVATLVLVAFAYGVFRRGGGETESTSAPSSVERTASAAPRDTPISESPTSQEGGVRGTALASTSNAPLPGAVVTVAAPNGDGKGGQIGAREVREQMNSCSCLTLLLACIIYWQAKEISRLARQADPGVDDVDLSLLKHVSPIEWDNVVIYGRYHFDRKRVRSPKPSPSTQLTL